MLERLKRLWKLSDPKYIDFLDRQTRAVNIPNGMIDRHEGDEALYNGRPHKPATVVQDDPLDIFPVEEQEGEVNNLTR